MNTYRKLCLVRMLNHISDVYQHLTIIQEVKSTPVYFIYCLVLLYLALKWLSPLLNTSSLSDLVITLKHNQLVKLNLGLVDVVLENKAKRF